MDDFDPYAEPMFNLEQTKSSPAPGVQGTPRPEKVESRAEFQDVDPHVTLSYNGLVLTFLRGGGLTLFQKLSRGLPNSVGVSSSTRPCESEVTQSRSRYIRYYMFDACTLPISLSGGRSTIRPCFSRVILL